MINSTETESVAHFWVAKPHRFGPGKTHVIDPELLNAVWDVQKTMCGRFLRELPGRSSAHGFPDCQSCEKAIRTRSERQTRKAEWAKREVERAEQNEQWWRWYNAYLLSPEWLTLRALVLKRANGICEGCGRLAATQVHHLSYANVGKEFLWELRAVCTPCHDRLHPDER